MGDRVSEIVDRDSEIRDRDREMRARDREIEDRDREMGGGDREMGDGDREMGGGDREMGDGDSEIGDREREMGDGDREIGDREGDGDREMGSGDGQRQDQDIQRHVNRDRERQDLRQDFDLPDLTSFPTEGGACAKSVGSCSDVNRAQETVSETICKICYSPLHRRAAVLPCGHAQFCYTCIKRWHQMQTNTGCPLCRTKIQSVLPLLLD